MPETIYQLRVRDPTTGDPRTILEHWRSVSYERRVNSPGSIQLHMWGGDTTLKSHFDTDAIVEVWRRYSGGSWYRDAVGLHRSREDEITSTGLKLFTAYQSGLLDLLARRILMGYAGTAYTDKTDAAETLFKEFVTEQAVSGAIARAITGLTVAADGAGGLPITVTRAWRSLLDVLQEFGGFIAGGDFGLEISETDASLIFRFYDGQFGLDRTWGNVHGNAPAVFSAERGNLRSVRYGLSRAGEVTAVIVGGKGEEEEREIEVRTDTTAIAESPWNRIEVFAHATQADSAAALQEIGDARLEEGQARETLTCEVMQTAASVYGRDYDLGDLVTFVFDGTEWDKQIVAVAVTVNSDGEKVKLEMTDVAY